MCDIFKFGNKLIKGQKKKTDWKWQKIGMQYER